MKFTARVILAAAIIVFLASAASWAGPETYEQNDWIGHNDVAGSRDITGISRFKDSIIQYYRVMKWDKYILPLSRIENKDGGKDWKKKKVIEGRITRIQYSVSSDNNPAFIAHNYRTALEGAGWKILFRGCGDQELGNESYEWWFYYYGNEKGVNAKPGCAFDPRGRDHCYLAARYDNALSTYYAAIYIVNYEESSKGLAFSLITQDVVQVQKARTGLVTAGKMGQGLAAKGHVALYGLYFDTGRADIKPESEPTLEQIAALLAQKPDLKLYVVGHTDDTGSLKANLTLSGARAEAVVKRLVDTYHIAPQRLTAGGVGPLCPVASNDSQDGRALNRRVELVKVLD